MDNEPNQINVRDSFKPVLDPLVNPLDRRGLHTMTSTRTYVDPPESLRDADQALIRLRASLSALGTAYLLGDVRAIQAGLEHAIGHAEDVVKNLKMAHDRSTRT